MAIILHNPHDRLSREFVNTYKEGNTVLNYPECVQSFPYISAFPSVVVDLPEKTILEYTIPETNDPETGEIIPEQTYPTEVIPPHQAIVRKPATWEDVEQYIQDYINYDPGAEWRT